MEKSRLLVSLDMGSEPGEQNIRSTTPPNFLHVKVMGSAQREEGNLALGLFSNLHMILRRSAVKLSMGKKALDIRRAPFESLSLASTYLHFTPKIESQVKTRKENCKYSPIPANQNLNYISLALQQCEII